jgi:opacity protein-like surface antigen
MAADAQAQNNCSVDKKSFYAKIFSGANFLQNTTIDGNKCAYQTGYIIAGSLGYFCYYGLHVEGEYAYRRNGIRKIRFFGQGSSHHGHFQTSSYMANLLWDFPLCSWGCILWPIRPFVGAGIGCDFQQMHASSSRIAFHQKWTHLSWQAMTGLVFPIFRKTDMTLEYKFHQGGSHFYNHSVGIGLVYKFGFLK